MTQLWNEPPWAHDPWDTRYRLYDNPPPELERPAVQFGLAARLQTTLPPGGVRYNWAGSHKSGFNSLLALPSPDPAPVTVQLPAGFAASRAYDLVTRTDVSLYRLGDGQVTYEVADNPVALLITVGCH